MGILANPLSTDPASVDLLSPSLYERGVPHDVFRHLREHEPLSFRHSAFAGPKDPGYWLLTRHADVHSILLDTSSYSSYRGGTNLLDESPDQLDAGRMMLINMDPPNHTRYRRLITRSFAARAVADLEPHVRTLCTQVVDNIIDRGQCEFVRDVASQVPMQVIFMLLGVPEQDWAYLCELTDTMMNNGGTEAAIVLINSSSIGPGPLGIFPTNPIADAPKEIACAASSSLDIQQILILGFIDQIFIKTTATESSLSSTPRSK